MEIQLPLIIIELVLAFALLLFCTVYTRTVNKIKETVTNASTIKELYDRAIKVNYWLARKISDDVQKRIENCEIVELVNELTLQIQKIRKTISYLKVLRYFIIFCVIFILTKFPIYLFAKKQGLDYVYTIKLESTTMLLIVVYFYAKYTLSTIIDLYMTIKTKAEDICMKRAD